MVTNKVSPQITTIIPTFRRPRLLRRALRSILDQTYPHFRVCIYDNASGDETAQVVQEVAQGDSRVRYHCHAQNLGPGPNFLYGMDRVDTPYFSFLSDDDVLLPDFYDNALAGFEKFPEAAFSGLGVVLMQGHDQLGVLVPEAFPEGLCRPPEALRNMLTMYPPLWTAILFRKELLEEVGLIDIEVAGLDIDYELRVAAHRPIVFSRRPGALMDVHPGAANIAMKLEWLWPGYMNTIRHLADDVKLDPEMREFAFQSLVRVLKRKLFVDFGVRAIIDGRVEEARRSAQILASEFDEAERARVLRCLDGVLSLLPPLRKVSSLALRLRRSWQKARWKPAIQRQAQCFREYEGYMKCA